VGALPPVFMEFLGSSAGIKTAIRGVKTELATVDAEGAGSFAKTGMLGKAAILGLGVAAVEVVKKTVEMAGDFQFQMTRVRTGAGEAADNMKMVGDGVLAMAGKVGQSTTELTSGLYMVESASYHGSDALHVLETAAEGAKVGAADLKTTTDAVTTAMNAYKSGADSVVPTMNALIATESEGKTNLEDLAGSMSTILPTAAAAKVGLNEVLGAMATMTAQGTPARVAATYLRQTIGMLSNPSAKAAAEMKSLGLNAVQVGQELGSKGLAATLTTLTDAIESHMGPAGTVLIDKLKSVSGNATEFQKVLANLPPTQQTYIGALATMVGGTKSMMGALQLTGPHLTDFQKNTAGVAEHVKAGGKEVEGWSDVQKNFNQRLDQAKASAQALGIQVGTILMPYVQKLVSWVAQSVTWLTQHQQAAKIAAIVIGGVLVFALAAATAAMIDLAVAAAANPVTWIVLSLVALIAVIVMLALHWRQVWAGIKDIAAATGKFLSGIWDDVAGKAVATWDSITGTVQGAWQATASYLTGAWHTVVDPIVAAWGWVASTTVAVWDGISGFFRKWWPLLFVIFFPVIALFVAIWNHFHTQIIGTVLAAWNGILSFLRATWSVIAAVAAVVWTAIRVAVVNPVIATWRFIVGVWTAATGWLAARWASIHGTASTGWNRVRTAMTGPVSAAWSAITGIMGRIKTAVSNGFTGAYNAVRNIGGKFVSVGEDIVRGIVQGIGNAAGLITDKLRNLANSALSDAKSFLGIGSPSKKFADQVGHWIPAGIAKGAQDNAGVAHRAMYDLVSSLPTAGALAGGGSLALGIGAAGGATIIHQHLHVTVQGHVMTDKQLVSVVQEGFLQLGAQNPATYQPYTR
jgi:TP901 family phage tail tape measure protein